jgi:hypothetical protein
LKKIENQALVLLFLTLSARLQAADAMAPSQELLPAGPALMIQADWMAIKSPHREVWLLSLST